MEQQDWHMIGADCLVISCCCQCLLLQLLVFLLLKLPIKLVEKTKHYVKRKLRNKMQDGEKVTRMKVARCAEEVVGCRKPRNLIWVQARANGFRLDGFDGCMDEVEEVLEELSTKGEFGFGSFWSGDDGVEVYCPVGLVNQELG
ncbi:hypothetical protein Hanom_Chr15g01384071 [Helianthus anomalus]